MRLEALSLPLRWLSDAVEFRPFADACQTPTVHGRALPVSCDRKPMRSIWFDCAP